MRSPVMVLLFSMLVACGGESGVKQGNRGSVSLDRNNIVLTTEVNQPVVHRVTVRHAGEYVDVGLPPGSFSPDWFYVNGANQSYGLTVFEIVMQPHYEGTYNQSLRFAAGLNGASESVDYQDLKITLHSIKPMNFSSTPGETDMPPAQRIEMSAGQLVDSYKVSVEYLNSPAEPWLRVSGDDGGYNAEIISTNLPSGNYKARITLSAENQSDVVRTVAYDIDALSLDIAEIPDRRIDSSTTPGELEFSVSAASNSKALDWEIVNSSELITVSKAPDGNAILINLIAKEIERLENGSHDVWFEVSSRNSLSGDQGMTRHSFVLDIDFTKVKLVSPRVVYRGKETLVRITGEKLHLIGDDVFLSSPVIARIERIDNTEIEATIASNAKVGRYAITVPNGLNITPTSAAIIVKKHPEFPVGELTLPQRARQVIYDADRERFYFPGASTGSDVYAITHNGNAWQWNQYAIPKATSIALTQDGQKLIVGTSSDCQIWEVAIETSEIANPNPPTMRCFYERFGFVGQFYNGLTLVANTNGMSGVWTYPDWGSIPFSLPHELSPFGIISSKGTHMVWAGGYGASGGSTAYVYDAKNNVINVLGTVGGTYYSRHRFRISASGNRLAHENDIYNAQLAYIGSLDATSSRSQVGISPDGTMAAHHEYETGEIRLFDITAENGHFPELAHKFQVSRGTTVTDNILFSDDNRYLFVFRTDYGTNISKMEVFSL